MKIVHCNWFPPKGYKAITLLKWIVVRGNIELKEKDVNHESIHYEQEKEMLFVFFYLWYVMEFLARLAFIGKWHQAYRAISFEREAYMNERDSSYISRRRHYSWFKLI